MKKCSILVPLFFIVLCLAACGGGNDTTTSTSSAPKPTPTATTAPTPTPAPDGWLRTDDGNVRFLKWTVAANGTLTGLWSAATLQNNKAVFQNGTLTGTINGDNVSLTMSLGGQSQTAAGTLANGVLTLQEADSTGALQSVVYHPCTTDAYNKAVNDFKAAHPTN